jgi:Phage terminase, small subunit
LAKLNAKLSAELDQDALERYERALRDAVDVRAAWEASGQALTYELSNGALVLNPLWKALQDAERHAARMGRELRLPGRPGRKPLLEGMTPGAAVAPLPAPPSQRLRRV